MERRSGLLTLVGALTLLGGCQDDLSPDDTPDLTEPRVGPRPLGDAVGPLAYAPEPSLRRSLCPTGVGCSTADVNRDGKDDLVRFDSFGVFGPPGNVEVAYSNGWDFGPMRSVAEGVCIDESGCTVADVDADGFPDLVRFIRDGGTNGVEVYLGIEASLGDDLLFEEPVLWADGLCALGQQCTVGDVTGDGRADLVAFTGDQDGQVLVSVSLEELGLPPAPWGVGLCTSSGSTCHLGDVNGDGSADAIELDGAGGSARVSLALPGGGFGPPQSWADDIVCPPGASCQVGDFDGDLDADVIAMGPGTPAADPDSCEGHCGNSAPGGCWCDELCTQYGDCCTDHETACQAPVAGSCEGQCGGSAGECWCDELCTEYEDCCLDYDAACMDEGGGAAMVRIWPAMGDHFGPPLELQTTACDPGQRCWAADVTGDGRVDLLSVDDAGVLALWPSEDVVDRLERDALRLTLLRADWERRRASQARLVIDDITLAVAPPPPWMMALPQFATMTPTPPAPPSPTEPAPPLDPLPELAPWPGLDPGAIDRDWFELQDAARVAELEAGITAVLDALPDESGLVWTADQRRWQGALGKVIAARTSLYAPPLGVDGPSRGGACHNAVVHDRIPEDGVDRHEGSYIARYYDGLRQADLNERLWATLPALTGIVEGMRCLSQQELAALEEAFVRAVVTTMEDLLARGHAPLAQIVWDQALPVELLLFDGVKSFTMPKGWQLLQVSIDDTGALLVPAVPEPGSDFDAFIAEDATTCSTVRCRLYKGASRATESGHNLTLDTLGIWLPDFTVRERLRRSLVHPESLLDALVNLEVLGEGDCPLIEVSFHALSCKSKRTCQFATELAEADTLGFPIRPGSLGSPHTHFGTNRADLADANGCGAPAPGGTPPPSTCTGPELRGHRGRHVPLDPELDAVLSCALETYDGGVPTETPVAVDLDIDPDCLLATDPPQDPSKIDFQDIDDAMQAVGDILEHDEGAGTEWGLDRETMISLIMMKTGASYDDVLASMLDVADQTFRHGWPEYRDSGSGFRGGMLTWADESGGIHHRLWIDRAAMEADLEELTSGMDPATAADTVSKYMFFTLMHEAIHAIVSRLVYAGATTGDVESLTDTEIQHEITDALGISCDPESGGCSTACGYNDARVARFSECLAGGAPEPFDRCLYEVDYCGDRRHGNLEFDPGLGCEAPELPPLPPLCAAVLCGDGSDLSGACCGGTTPDGEPVPYGPTTPGPDPHPGDPDGPLPPVPGGPGGVPIPPLPIPPLPPNAGV